MEERRRSILGSLFAVAIFPLLVGWTVEPAPAKTKTIEKKSTTTWKTGLHVDLSTRESSRTFYRAVYQASEDVPSGWNGNTAAGIPGTTTQTFRDAKLLRIRWFRAMAGVPADTIFRDEYNAKAQKAALMFSANNAISHNPPPTWKHYDADAAEAARKSNIGLGGVGAHSIYGAMLDPGSSNDGVGHRRWLLYPQTHEMGAGDVEKQGDNSAAEATWVSDANYFAPRPETRDGFVAWPPKGWVPHSVVFGRWSFAWPNANFSKASVTMTKNGAPLAVSLETLHEYAENTLVWVPEGFASDKAMAKPTNDVAFEVSVRDVFIDGKPRTFTYSVNAFDPAVAGDGFVSAVVTGPSTASVSADTPYVIGAVPQADGYRWQEARVSKLVFEDSAELGNKSFVAHVSPGYAVTSNDVAASGKSSFHLAMPEATDQSLELDRSVLASSSTQLRFASKLMYASKGQVPHVQVKPEGSGVWQDVWTHSSDSKGESDKTFTTINVSLASFAGRGVRVRFLYAYEKGSFYPGTKSTGWYVDDVSVTGADELSAPIDHETSTTAFAFRPTTAGRYALRASPRFYSKYWLDWGPARIVDASIGGPTPVPPPVPTTPPKPSPTTPPPFAFPVPIVIVIPALPPFAFPGNAP